MAIGDVTLGDTVYTIEPFSGFKTIEVSATIAEIFDAVPGLYERAAEFRSRYVEVNRSSMDRVSAEMRYDAAKEVSEQAWQAADHKLTIEDEPGEDQYVIAVVGEMFRVARARTVRLLAILLTPNSKFEEHDTGAGEVDVDEAIVEARRNLMHKARGEQLIDVGRAAWAVINEQFGDPLEGLGKAFARGRERLREAQEQAKPPTQSASDAEPASSPERSDERDLSDDSPARSDGPDAKSSTRSRGSSSSSSAPV